MNVIDVLGIFIFCTASYIIYKKAWFYSFYSFVKFLVVFFLSFAFSLFVSTHNLYNIPLTTLQQSLIIQFATFLILWKLITFKHMFFSVSRHIFDIDRFIFVHHINPYINVFPSIIASFFLTFFLFTAAVSQGAGNSSLQAAIEKSSVVKPIAYDIYFAGSGRQHFNFFNGTLFKITPAVYFPTGASLGNIKNQAILAFRQKLDIQRFKAGLFTLPAFLSEPEKSPSGEVAPYIPSNPPSNTAPVYKPYPTQAPYVPQPTQQPYNPIQNPTPAPVFENPTPTTFQSFPSEPTATPVPVYQPPPQTQPQPADTNQVEQDIFTLVNEQRQQNGVAPLTLDSSLSAVARAHSVDMNTRNFFDHVNPDGLDPFQRMRIGGISFSTAGENIAGGQSAGMMMTNWMNSAGHRANILNPAFTKIGIGVSASSRYGLLATQDFTN